jgi:hypothetical protein
MAMSRGQNELIGEVKIAGDVISTKKQVMEYMFIPTGIKMKLVRFGIGRGLLEEDQWPFFLVDRLFLVSPT